MSYSKVNPDVDYYGAVDAESHHYASSLRAVFARLDTIEEFLAHVDELEDDLAADHAVEDELDLGCAELDFAIYSEAEMDLYARSLELA